jgi:hypothetical protein
LLLDMAAHKVQSNDGPVRPVGERRPADQSFGRRMDP